MSKKIWEYNTYNDASPLVKYTVVYENKTYYYCKVSGTDDLRKFEKSNVETNDRYLVTSGEESSDVAPIITSRMVEENRKRLERSVMAIETGLRYIQDSAAREEDKLDCARKTLAKFNSEHPKQSLV